MYYTLFFTELKINKNAKTKYKRLKAKKTAETQEKVKRAKTLNNNATKKKK